MERGWKQYFTGSETIILDTSVALPYIMHGMEDQIQPSEDKPDSKIRPLNYEWVRYIDEHLENITITGLVQDELIYQMNDRKAPDECLRFCVLNERVRTINGQEEHDAYVRYKEFIDKFQREVAVSPFKHESVASAWLAAKERRHLKENYTPSSEDSPREIRSKKLKILYDAAERDRKILAHALVMAEKSPVLVLSYDGDMTVFSNAVCKASKHKIYIINPDHFRDLYPS